MADKTMTYRLVVKEVAAWHGYYATFMPKPLFGENGSGMHTHMSLFKGGRNQFFDAKDPNHLSTTAKAFIAGLLVHARELSAVLAQWVNSYKRLVPGLRGAGLRRVVAAQPLGADPDPALQAGLRAGDPRRDPLPRPGLQPVPRLRGAAPRRPRGDREGLRAAGRDDDEPLPALGRGARASTASTRCPGSLGEAIEAFAGSELMQKRPRRAHLPALRRAQARRVGRVPHPGDRSGSWTGTCRRSRRMTAGGRPGEPALPAARRGSDWTTSAEWRIILGAGAAARRAARLCLTADRGSPVWGPWSLCGLSGSRSRPRSWLFTVDHKRIGIMYGVAAIGFFIVGGIEALAIRAQLADRRHDPVGRRLQPDVHDARHDR